MRSERLIVPTSEDSRLAKDVPVIFAAKRVAGDKPSQSSFTSQQKTPELKANGWEVGHMAAEKIVFTGICHVMTLKRKPCRVN